MVHVSITVAIWGAKGNKMLCINVQDSDFYKTLSYFFFYQFLTLKGKGKAILVLLRNTDMPKSPKNVQMRIY